MIGAGYIVKVEQTGFASRPNIQCERKKSQGDTKVLI